MISGVYAIRNQTNGKFYIGSSGNCDSRWKSHFNSLRRGDHHSIRLQRAWNKYGASAFVPALLFVCKPEMLLFYEQRAIDGLSPHYNASPSAGSCAGVKRSDETRAKMREAWARRGITEAQKQHLSHMSAMNKGIKKPPMSDEQKKKLSVINTGKRTPDDVKEKIRQAMIGRFVSDDTRARMSAARALFWQRKKEINERPR